LASDVYLSLSKGVLVCHSLLFVNSAIGFFQLGLHRAARCRITSELLWNEAIGDRPNHDLK
jgi:hypothetical protein